MSEYFCHITGEYIDLARAEIETLIEMCGGKTIHWSGRFCTILAPTDPTEFLLERAAFLREAGKIVYRQAAPLDVTAIPSNILRSWVRESTNFHIRFLSISRELHRDDCEAAVRALGAQVRLVTGARVSFEEGSSLCSVRMKFCSAGQRSLSSGMSCRSRPPNGNDSFIHQ